MKNSRKRIRDRQGKLFRTTIVALAAITCASALGERLWAHSPATDHSPANNASATQTARDQPSIVSGAAVKPAFEVASIKKDTSNTNMVRIGGPDVTRGPDPSRFSAANVTAKMLIGFAYDMRDFQISGGPPWIGSERFDVDAKVDDDLAQKLQKLPRDRQLEQTRLMLQSLLADRFQLSVTPTQKDLPIFALMVAKGGPKLTEAAPITSDSAPDTPPAGPPPPGAVVRNGAVPTPPPGAMMVSMRNGLATVTMKAAPLSALTMMLSQQMGRQIIDETGLKGMYDITLQFSPEGGMFGGPLPRPPASADAPDSSGTSIFTALQEQLGLKLESKKGPVDTIVIEHIDEPTPN